jgi:hypothetical protein
MPSKKNTKTIVRHDPRKWTLKALESATGGVPLSTSQILSKASALSGNKIPYYSISQALRTLVRRRKLVVKRNGRELMYRLATAAPVAVPRRAKRTAPKVAPASEAPTPAVSSEVALALPMPAVLHKIAPGEIALLHVSETHVEAATNVDGKLVLKRHARPA